MNSFATFMAMSVMTREGIGPTPKWLRATSAGIDARRLAPVGGVGVGEDFDLVVGADVGAGDGEAVVAAG